MFAHQKGSDRAALLRAKPVASSLSLHLNRAFKRRKNNKQMQYFLQKEKTCLQNNFSFQLKIKYIYLK